MDTIEISETARQHKQYLNDMLWDLHLKIKEVCCKMGLSTQCMYKYLNKKSLNNNFPAYLIPLLTRTVTDKYLNYINTESGYIAVRMPDPDADVKDAFDAARRAMTQATKALNTFSDAIEDKEVDNDEWVKILHTIRPALQGLQTLEFMASKLRTYKPGK